MHFNTTNVAIVPIICFCILTPITNSWWTANTQLVLDLEMKCSKARSNKMLNICNKKRGLLKQISEGITLGQKECQYQFRYRRWNCTSARKSIKRVLKADTRETSFVNAIIAAGITFQITMACTKGELIGCSCSKRKKMKKTKKKYMSEQEKDFKWNGCGENIEFGMRKSKDFLDITYKRRSDLKNKIKLHNYVAGRLAIRNNMTKACKCHGMSGSCTVKTCSLKMPTFREIGNMLKERFDGAVKVIPSNDGESFRPAMENIKPPTKIDLVYLEDSPSYCNFNRSLGSFGTKGRECSGKLQSEEGCDILCCRRGSIAYTSEVQENCNCKFKYCCNVECEICTTNKTTYFCL